MTPPAERYPGLARLFGAYVHQDYDLDGPTPDAAVRRFADEVDPSVRAAAHRELGALLAAAPGEARLEALLDALGCGHRPRGGAAPARAWLRHVRTLLAASARRPPG